MGNEILNKIDSRRVILSIKKNILTVFVLLLFLVVFFSKGSSFTFSEEKDISLAVCPTFYYVADNSKDLNFIKTKTTAESLYLLTNKEVDFVISGRPLKDGESDFNFEIIGEGYDFIFEKEIIIMEEEMLLVPFYTNLDPKIIIEDFEYISEDNLIKISKEDIDNHLKEGVIITFLDDRIKGGSVHIFNENGKRVRLSRRPRIYYSSLIEEDELNKLKEILFLPI